MKDRKNRRNSGRTLRKRQKNVCRRQRKAVAAAAAMTAVLFCSLLMTGCNMNISVNFNGSKDEKVSQKTVFAMDTVMSLKAFGVNGEAAIEAAEDEIYRLDRLMQRSEDYGEIYQLNRDGSKVVSEDTAAVIRAACEIAGSTGGAFDPSIAPVGDLWGFYGQKFRVPADQEISAALPLVGWDKISVNGSRVSLQPGMKIDLGGIAKGYLSDRIIKIFKEKGVTSGLISLGGNVQTLGKKTDGSLWSVSVQDPEDEDSYIGNVHTSDMALVTSGSYQQSFEEDGVTYHHILDPKTGRPADSGLTSVTIIGKDGTRADGLSTALFVMGLEKGIDYWKSQEGFDVIFVTSHGEIYITEGIEEMFESTHSYEVVRR